MSELRHLLAWLQVRAVQEVVMESTAQYWKPVWLALEGSCRLHLAQARSNRGPRGHKTDFRDAQRALSRLRSGDLILSYVPEAEQRCWRTLTRTKYQLTRDKVRLQSQLESLLEECQIKLSSVVSDLPGPAASASFTHWRRVKQILPSLLSWAISACVPVTPNVRLAELPGLGLDSAQQIIAEIGPTALAFPSAAQLASWVGVCPGRQESSSDRSAKGNRSNASAAQSTRARCSQEGRLSVMALGTALHRAAAQTHLREHGAGGSLWVVQSSKPALYIGPAFAVYLRYSDLFPERTDVADRYWQLLQHLPVVNAICTRRSRMSSKASGTSKQTDYL
jgi:transposase